MKKAYLLVIFVMTTMVANAQFVNGGSTSSSRSGSGLYSSGNGAHFEGSFGTSLSFSSLGAGPSVDTEMGCRVRDYLFVGAGVGFHTVFSSVDCLLSLPIYANIKGFLPIHENIKPFVSYSVGPHLFWLPFSYYSTFIDFYTNVGLGVEVGHHQFSAGYELMGIHTGYIKYAITF